MKWFSLFCLLLYTNIFSLHCQIYAVGGGDPLGYAHKIDTLDTYNIQVKYQMKFMPDTLVRDKYNSITTVLHLGSKGISFFKEYNSFCHRATNECTSNPRRPQRGQLTRVTPPFRFPHS